MKYLIKTYICDESGKILQESSHNTINIPTFMVLERDKEDLIDYLLDNSAVLNPILKSKSYTNIQIDFKRDNLKILVSDFLPLFSLSLVDFDDDSLDMSSYMPKEEIEVFSD